MEGVYPGLRLSWEQAPIKIAELLNRHNQLTAPLKTVNRRENDAVFYEEAFGDILASCTIEFPLLPNKSLAKIKHLVVNENYRHIGLGYKIVDKSINYFRNIKFIFATIRKDNLYSIKLFKNLGFNTVTEIDGASVPIVVVMKETK